MMYYAWLVENFAQRRKVLLFSKFYFKEEKQEDYYLLNVVFSLLNNMPQNTFPKVEDAGQNLIRYDLI